MASFKKLIIRSIETGTKVEGTYNPKELEFSKDAGWTEEASGLGTDSQTLQFTSGKSITMSIPIIFDKYEQGGDVRGDIGSIMSMALIEKSLGRPPMVQVMWHDGNILFDKGSFTGVIKSVSTKYTMFLEDGTPCRATATVSLMQAEEVTLGGSGSASSVKMASRPQDLSASENEALVNQGIDPADTSNYPVAVKK